MFLPYWDSDLEVEAGFLSSAAAVRRPLTAAGFYSPALRELSEFALSVKSELLYMCGAPFGWAGSMIWEEVFFRKRTAPESSPFTLLFGYSAEMERVSAAFLQEDKNLAAGVSECLFWNGNVPHVSCKVIAFVAADERSDTAAGFEHLVSFAGTWKRKDPLIPFYAEQFGFVRAPCRFETDDPRSLLASARLDDFQLTATENVVGPSPSVPLPPCCGLSSDSAEEDG